MPDGARVTGVTRGVYEYAIAGSGVIVGVMFRPGGIAAFYDSPRDLVDRSVAADQLFPNASAEFNRRVLASDDQRALDLLHELLATSDPQPDPNIALVNEIIARSQSAQELTVRDLAAEFGTSLRSLQSLFERYVGVGLKWIMLRDRLQHATLIAETVDHPDWTQIAYDLGYSDQSHFINDFKRIVGVSPGKYSREARL